MRLSEKEAIDRGWVKPGEVSTAPLIAKAMAKAGLMPPPAPLNPPNPPKARAHKPKHGKENRIQAKLYQAILARFPDAVSEFQGAVPGRRFSLDIALPTHRIAIEMDGYRSHGLSIHGFKRDRLRDRLLTLHGWRVLRFFAQEVINDADQCAEQVCFLVNNMEAKMRCPACDGYIAIEDWQDGQQPAT